MDVSGAGEIQDARHSQYAGSHRNRGSIANFSDASDSPDFRGPDAPVDAFVNSAGRVAAWIMVPQLLLIARAWKWWLPGGVAFAGLLLLFGGLIDARPGGTSPNNIYYALNADSGKATWAGDVAQQDQWGSQFLSGGTQGNWRTLPTPIDPDNTS